MQHQRRVYQPTQSKAECEVKRLVGLNETSCYWTHRRYVFRKSFRVVERTQFGVEVEFVNEEDRKALNNAAGWSDNKRTYIIDGAKYE